MKKKGSEIVRVRAVKLRVRGFWGVLKNDEHGGALPAHQMGGLRKVQQKM